MYNFLPFSGSYLPDDVQFLLRPVTIDMTPVELKEQLIQSGTETLFRYAQPGARSHRLAS